MQENDIEQLAIELLKQQGCEYIHGSELSPSVNPETRLSYSSVILHQYLQAAVQRINPEINHNLQQDAIAEINNIIDNDLLTANEKMHKLLTSGITVTEVIAGEERGKQVYLIDFTNPENNHFLVVNQFTIIENGKNKRPDIILFINGLPLVVIELKNPTDEDATLASALRQLETYKTTITSLFIFNAFNIISDGLEALAGSLSASLDRFMPWKIKDNNQHTISQLETLITAMLNKTTLLDIIKNFIVFEDHKTQDQAGIVTIKPIKKLASYHQYYAVNKAVTATLAASGFIDNKIANRKGGVVWHTTGSGKSLTMVFYAAKIIQKLNNPTLVIITDRNDLDQQLFNQFSLAQPLLRQTPKQATSCGELQQLLQVVSGGIIFTTIQKFRTDDDVYPCLSKRSNIVVIADEAHRTQYGFVNLNNIKNNQGEIIGKTATAGFAQHMRSALPNASYIGFTGTPIETQDRNTRQVFGDYIDIYDISQSVADGVTVPIYYEARLAKIAISDEGKKLIDELDAELQLDELAESEKSKIKWQKLASIVGSQDRLQLVANDIINHFSARQQACSGKAMIVTMSRQIACDLYDNIIAKQPSWHNNNLNQGKIKVVITSQSADGASIAKHHTSKHDRNLLARRMKDVNDELQLVIVCDMWLTGFDVPCMHTIYLDKPMQGLNLIQSISRVNRVYKDKPGGLVVDYLGIASDLKQALGFYANSGGKGEPAVDQNQALKPMQEKLEVIRQMLHGFNYQQYFTSDTVTKLNIILAAENHILGLADGKKRFINAVASLSSAFTLAVPLAQAIAIKDELALFQAIKARLVKFTQSITAKSADYLTTIIKQTIDEALVSSKVIDLFDAAGINKPDISVLSDEFLAEVKGMKHKNIALELLKRLLNDEIKARSKTNLVKAKSIKQMLDEAIKNYHNKSITALEVIEELIEFAKDLNNADCEATKLKLTKYEYAFYSAVAANGSARELMQQDVLRELAVALTTSVKQNTSIDWQQKHSARAKLRTAIKRLLRKYGYPPDMQQLAIDNVIAQAELMATSC